MAPRGNSVIKFPFKLTVMLVRKNDAGTLSIVQFSASRYSRGLVDGSNGSCRNPGEIGKEGKGRVDEMK